ncbi:unnamed protein product [Blumeria hordei]|uniref:FYVE-type domain-containing protein n=1 Tax=Blumeria hordei TaxID=2867405 RepID=A0A383V226_BLUHO|nr:unnamed protein product [Blumeria hordei]
MHPFLDSTVSMSTPRYQLRPPKSPLYVPAVLRPTEPPRRLKQESQTPMSPRSLHEEALRMIGTADSSKYGIDGEFGIPEAVIKGLGQVTGPPTRVHWKPDVLSAHCDDPSGLCTRNFTTFYRRHHCRRCGLVFCQSHSTYLLPLDQDANFHPRGARTRGCESCWFQWIKWVEVRRSAAMKAKKKSSPEVAATPKPVHDAEVHAKNVSENILPTNPAYGKEPRHLSVPSNLGSVPQSVPRDWHWSTF